MQGQRCMTPVARRGEKLYAKRSSFRIRADAGTEQEQKHRKEQDFATGADARAGFCDRSRC
jgi:hypothetical protein